jgi:hypothetical protein
MLVDSTQRTQDWRSEIPALQEFSDAALALFRPADPATLFGCRAALERLVGTDWLERLVSTELAHLAGLRDRSGGGLNGRRMTLFGAGGMALSLVVLPPAPATPPGQLFGAVRNHLFAVRGPGELAIARFFQPWPHPIDVLDRARRLEDRGVQTVQPGQSAAVLLGHDVVTVRACGAPVVALMLEAEAAASLCWRYDGSTLLPVATVRAAGEVTRLEFAAGAVARLGDERCTPALQSLFRHPDHVVRWAAARALMQVDRPAGEALLAAALEDPHPHLRQAARIAVDRLNARRLAQASTPEA